ncbi:MAG: methionyl-tRNA formyltransferase [Pseudorhodoferax sp.]
MRIVFAGTPEFARVALAALHAHGFEIPLVLTQPDRPAGRGMKLQASPVKQFALEHDWPVAQPRSLRLDGKYPEEAAAAREALRAARPDAMVVAAYGLILPQWVLDLPRLGCLNIHASLLPRWRGAAPIHRAIEAGDAETGVTIMQMDAGLDTGDMLVEEALAIGEDSTARLHDRLAEQGGRLIVEALRQAEAGRLQPRPQPAEGITYAHKIEKAEAPIDWRLPAAAIARRLRAFDPFPGATTQLGGETLKCWAGRALPEATGLPPGTVLAADAAGLAVATGEGVLLLTELQRAGGKRLPAAAVLAGFAIQRGQVLG